MFPSLASCAPRASRIQLGYNLVPVPSSIDLTSLACAIPSLPPFLLLEPVLFPYLKSEVCMVAVAFKKPMIMWFIWHFTKM